MQHELSRNPGTSEVLFGNLLNTLPALKPAPALPQKSAKVRALPRLYPQLMEAQAVNTELPASFAGALAAFASDAAKPEQAFSDSGLANDLADDMAFLSPFLSPALSYESAVHTQSGFDLSDAADRESRANLPEPAGKKSASITIRLSQAEWAQLRKRAAAADLTVSAYMRSCILEAETLRAQVKEALAELRAATAATLDDPQAAAFSARQSPRRWWQLGTRSN
jgi:predicted DNA binding CopG/RHH family protein